MAQFRKDTNQYLSDSKTIFEVMMLADQYGNLVGPANPSGMAVDAFGRARVSQPFTLFDSYSRFNPSDKYSVANTSGGTYSFDANAATFSMTVDTTSGAETKRETKRVFAYQPGKSLQIMNTFIMGAPKTGLRQRIGYFSSQNGIFLEQDNTTISFVKRSYSTGSVVETKVSQSSWNRDKLDGTGPSGYTLDLTKAQILFIDIEWLGLGTVRCGFVINGELVHCHSFHHANILDVPYMTTACLPIRAEITNTSETANSSTLKMVCSTVISEGGYELRGRQKTAGQEPLAANNYTLTTAGTYYPVVSIRLKSDKLDGIVLPKEVALVGTTASDLKYKIVDGATITGGTWVSAGTNSDVEYNITGTSMSGGSDLWASYLISTGSQSPIAQLDSGTFKFQLERDSFTSTPSTFTLAVAAKSNSDKVIGTLNWEEVT